MAGDAQEIDFHRIDIEGDLAGRLGRIRVEQHAAFPAERADFSQRLHNADLVVHSHHRHQHRVVTDSLGNCLNIGQPVHADRQDRDLGALVFHRRTGFQYTFVFAGERHDVPSAPVAQCEPCCPLNSEVVGFCSTGGKDDLACFRADQPRDLLTRHIHGIRRLAAPDMLLGMRVAECLAEPR